MMDRILHEDYDSDHILAKKKKRSPVFEARGSLRVERSWSAFNSLKLVGELRVSAERTPAIRGRPHIFKLQPS